MKTYFITYSDQKYELHQKKLNEQAEKIFDGVYGYNREWLIKTEFYLENKTILDEKRGAGYWLWKPYIILETFKNIEYGDIICYLDCGDTFKYNLINFLKDNFKNETDSLLTLGVYAQRFWTKRDCFILMGCDNKNYHNQTQLEAGILSFKKTDKIIEILNEWLYYCKNENILTDMPNIHGENLTNFIDHRHDQSILTNLAIKYKLNINNNLRNFITCNVNQ